MERVKISNVALINNRNITKKDKYKTIKYLDTGNIIEGKINEVKEYNFTTDKVPSRAKRKVKNNTIIYSTVRPKQKHYGILNMPEDNFIVSTGFTTIDAIEDKINPLYLYYQLTKDSITKYLSDVADTSVSAYPSITPEDIGSIEIDVIPLEEQNKISKILSSFDEKIKINNKIIEELESVYKEIYNYWFLQFDFPDTNGNAYRTSGGRMSWNNQLNREIPEGWKVQNLKENDLTEILNPGIEKFEGRKIYLATGDVEKNNIIAGKNITYKNRESRANMQPIPNTIWFAKMKNTVKHIFVGEYSKSLIENYIFSTGFLGLKCVDKKFFEYINCFINSEFFESQKDKLAHGATQEAVNNNDVGFIPLLIPDNITLEKFHKATKDVFQKIYFNNLENDELNNLRDFLLPLLMNGQVKLKGEI